MDILLFSQRLKIEKAVAERKKEMLETHPEYSKTSDMAFTIIAMDELGLFNKDEVRKLACKVKL